MNFIKYYINSPHEYIFSDISYNNKIMQIFSQIVIKFNVEVIEIEIVN